jgi:hypothetical protein
MLACLIAVQFFRKIPALDLLSSASLEGSTSSFDFGLYIPCVVSVGDESSGRSEYVSDRHHY